jgi:hypothetical protein
VWFGSDDVELHPGVENPFAPARKEHLNILTDNFNGLRDRGGPGRVTSADVFCIMGGGTTERDPEP